MGSCRMVRLISGCNLFVAAIRNGHVYDSGGRSAPHIRASSRSGRVAPRERGVAAQGREVVGYLLYGDDVMEEHHTPMGGGDPWMVAVLHDPTAVDRYLRWDRYTLTSGGPVADGSLAPVIDIRNNVSAVVDGDGAIEPLVYDLHGNEMNPDHGDLYIPYRFAGRRLDEESGLYYNRTRYYSPELGRFISVDSIGIWGDLNNYGNGYAYVGNMGNGLLDPAGLFMSATSFFKLLGGFILDLLH
jgi:RHS repeat-associated protein